MRSKKSIAFSILLSLCLVVVQITPSFADSDIEGVQNEQVQAETAFEPVEEEAVPEEPEPEAEVPEENTAENSMQESEVPDSVKTELKSRAVSTDSKSENKASEEPSDNTIEDGTYVPDGFTYSGGTGKVKITCPEVTINDGNAKAEIVFSSTSYTKLQVNGEFYTSTVDSAAGTSTFSGVAVDVNKDVTIVGTTIAMSEPHDVSYVIHITLSSDSEITEGTGGSGETGGNTGNTEEEKPAEEPASSQKLANGKYKVKSDTDNRMFYIVTASDGIKWSVLKVTSKGMEATITLTGQGYDYLYMGTAAQAEKASKSKLCRYSESNGYYSYTLPVSELDKKLTVSAHSKSHDKWYEHTIIFYSRGAVKIKSDTAVTPGKPNTSGKKDETDGKKATSKQTASVSKSWKDDSGSGTSAVDNSTKLKDGTYTPSGFSWSGGTGRLAYIRCTKVIVKNGQAFGVIEFGSTKYDQLKANGRIYSNSNSGGLATFVIPVRLNANNTIIGRTIAMSQPHWIRYSIFISLPVKADGTVDETKAEAETEKLSSKAPEIMGLEYDSTIDIEYSEYFRLFRYNDGIVLLQLDATKDTALYKKTTETRKDDGEAEYDEDGNLIAKSQHEITMELYQNNIINYLLVPEGAEIPAGLEKNYVVVTVPADSTFSASEKASGMLREMKLTDYLTDEAEDGLESIDYKSIVKNKINMCILSSEVLPDAVSKDLTAKEKKELEAENRTKKTLLNSVELKFTALDIPVIIDRSDDEESRLAKKEWIKVYGALYGEQDLADSIFEAYKEKVK